MTKHRTGNVDIYQHVTNEILAMLDQDPGAFEMPWQRLGRDTLRPFNVATGRRYSGINILQLWMSAHKQGFTGGAWATFKQWRERGGAVRKGAKSTLAVFFKTITITEQDADGEPTEKTIPIGRAYPVFHIDQVDGISHEPPTEPAGDGVAAQHDADRFIAATGAAIHHDGGDRAFYRPATDSIHLPEPARFTGSHTASATERYYGVALHELTHWTSASHRCNRQLGERFGDAAYAAEELVAELGSAFLCADLGITPQTRRDHAAYIAAWQHLLRNDKRAVVTAASKASEAATYLHGLQPAAGTDAPRAARVA